MLRTLIARARHGTGVRLALPGCFKTRHGSEQDADPARAVRRALQARSEQDKDHALLECTLKPRSVDVTRRRDRCASRTS